jgi:hypothetical protein
MKNLNFFVLILFLGIFLVSLVPAEELNLTDEQKALLCIEESKSIMEILQEAGFSSLRINDTIKEAETVLEVQTGLEEKGRTADYSRVFLLCEEISGLKELAFQLKDEIKVLNEFYSSASEGIDTTEIDVILSTIEKEMTNERYELVPELIEQTYSEIILAQSKATTLNVFYEATTRGLKRFLTERWKEILLGIVAFILLFLFLKKPVEKALIRSSLRKIEIRKKSLKDMITKNQDSYFNKGKVSEESFTIRNKKLAELIRDVDRQISIFNEQLYALDHGEKVKEQLKKKKRKK